MRHLLALLLASTLAAPLAGCPAVQRPPSGPTMTLTGTVTAAHSGRALVRADVRIGATEYRAQTDATGRFTLSDVPESAEADTLLVMSQGFRWGREAIAGRRSFAVALDTTIVTLEEYLDEHQRQVSGEDTATPPP